MSFGNFAPPTQADIILNSKEGMLYSHDFGHGRFFQVVHSDEEGFEVKLATKTMLKAVYIKEADDIEGVEFIKLIDGEEKQRIKFSKFNLAQLKAFIQLLSEINLKGVAERRIQLVEGGQLSAETIQTFKDVTSTAEGVELVKQVLAEGRITSTDLVNIGYRKQQLQLYHDFLHVDGSLEHYRVAQALGEGVTGEKVWQYFFQKNPWIFGYGLDYRYMSILQREFHASSTDADGSGSVINDYLMADKRFTVFVEIKKPETELFRAASAQRANTWGLSRELTDAVSQVLEQKASGQVRLEQGGLYDEQGEPITQAGHDSKVILLIGSWTQLERPGVSAQERAIKTKTLELFRRDSRNIKILTYDELYDRAAHIVQTGLSAA
ncbi:MAG: Shedu immune nuclease family protein [Flavobacteriales bacterium]